jgi:hypothetical protein
MICPTGKVESFFKQGWTQNSDLPVGQKFWCGKANNNVCEAILVASISCSMRDFAPTMAVDGA